MMEYDSISDHIVDQCNIEVEQLPLENETEYLNMNEEPAFVLECPTDALTYQHEIPVASFQSIVQQANPTALSLPGNLSLQQFKDTSSSTRFTCLSKVTFPMKLWELLEEGEASLVQWTDNGLAIILDPQRFDEEIIEYFPGEFGDNKLRNFCRQLRVYDFNEVTIKDPNWGMFCTLLDLGSLLRIFYHHYFRRGHPEDLLQIVRVRDIVPRGRSRPKHPKPKQILPAPTGPYLLGQTPPKAKQRSYEPSPKRRVPAEGFGINTSTVASHLGAGHPLVASLMMKLAEETKSAALNLISGQEIDSLQTVENGSAPIPICIYPPKVEKPLPQDPDSSSAKPLFLTTNSVSGVVAESGQHLVFPVHKPPNVETSSVTSESSQGDFSDSESAESRSSREQKQAGRGCEAKGSDVMSFSIPANNPHNLTSDISFQIPTTIVLVPCLKTGDKLLPLSEGGSLSEAGALLRCNSEYQHILSQLRPPMVDKEQQCDIQVQEATFGLDIKCKSEKEEDEDHRDQSITPDPFKVKLSIVPMCNDLGSFDYS